MNNAVAKNHLGTSLSHSHSHSLTLTLTLTLSLSHFVRFRPISRGQVKVRVGRFGFGPTFCRDPRVTGRPNCPARGSRAGRLETSKPAGFTGSGRVRRIKYLLPYLEALADRR